MTMHSVKSPALENFPRAQHTVRIPGLLASAKIRWLCPTLAILAGWLGAPTTQAQLITEDLAAYFTFDAADWGPGTGAIINSQGTGNASILEGTGTISNLNPGQIGQAAQFAAGAAPGNESITGVNVNTANVGTNSFSVSLWFNNTTNSGLRTLINKGAGENTRVGWTISLYNSGATNQVIVGLNDSTSSANYVQKNYDYNPAGGFLDDWINLALVVDRDADTATIFINGLALTSTTGNTIRDFASLSSSIYALNFGTRYASPTGQLPFNGSLDDVGIWTRALSSTDVANIYNSGLDGLGIYEVVPEPSVTALLLFSVLFVFYAGRKRQRLAT